MYPNDTAAISDGAVTHVYSLVKLGEKDIMSVRRESAAPADQPSLLTIKHREVGSGLTAEVQSVLRVDRVVEDAQGNQGTVSCQLTLRWPSKITTAVIAQKGINEVVSFLAVAGYKDKFTNQEP